MQVRNASNVAKPRAESGLSIVIVTYNSAAVLPGLLDSLPAGLEGIKQFETIVVDNDSADNSVDIALAHPTRPRVIRMGRNAGYAAAINVGAATVRPECRSTDSQSRHTLAPRRGAFADRSFDGFVRRRGGAADPGRGRNDAMVAAPGTLRHEIMDRCCSRRNVGWAYRQR